VVPRRADHGRRLSAGEDAYVDDPLDQEESKSS